MSNLTDFQIEPLLVEFGNNLIADIRTEMQNQGLGDSNLSKSLEYEVDVNEIKVTAAPYLKYAEKGRGPGKVPYKFEDILLDWMHRYNIKPKYGTDAQFANAIKWKTIKEGSSIFRGDRRERDFTTIPIDTNLEWLEKQIGIEYVTWFVNDVKK